MKILANRMDLGFQKHQTEYEEAALRVLRSGWYILGKELQTFEEEFASYNATRSGEAEAVPFCCTGMTKSCDDTKVYSAGLASGLDALWIGIRMLGIGQGDEVIVCAHTFIASALAISKVGATPVLVDANIDDYLIDTSKIEEKITDKT
jgi:dTDP-4-amino-4,6-dideoxygalactose transaminase